MAKSSTTYINENDFEGAKLRFEQSNARWKRHWFNACVEIAERCTEWAKKYVFDPINLTITKIAEKVKRIIKKHNGASNVYLIKMFDENDNYVFLKGGKADDIGVRLNRLKNQEYKRDNVQISRVEIIKTWALPSSHLAESFEHSLHDYLCKFFENIPNDRYYPHELNAEQFAELDRRHEIICSFA